MPNLIDVQNVHLTYPLPSGGAIPALAGINLSVRPGEFLAILGRNGSGKSTLARLFNGLLLPTSGRVLVDGLDTRDAAARRDVRQRVGLIFQSPEIQLIANTVEEDVAFGPENLGLPHDELRQRVRWALDRVGMWDHRTRAPHMLSAGQKQRVAIAGVLAMRPLCIVLDEATSMLDPAGRREVLQVVAELRRAGTTVVTITHHVEETTEADRIAVLEKGRLVGLETPQALFARPDWLASAGLEVPPVTRLVHQLRRRGVNLRRSVLTGDDLAHALADYQREMAQ